MYFLDISALASLYTILGEKSTWPSYVAFNFVTLQGGVIAFGMSAALQPTPQSNDSLGASICMALSPYRTEQEHIISYLN